MSVDRRYDIDWLRVIAIGLLLIYHIAIGFQPWGVFIGFIQNNDVMEWIWTPMSLLNVWRIPLLFFVSGMGVYFAIQKRDWKNLLKERSRRILLPFLFGMFTIVPLHVWLWQNYYHQELTYTLNPAHLWFLANIFIYVLLFTPVFFYLKNNRGGRLHTLMNKIMAKPFALALLMIPCLIEVNLVQPENFELYAMTPHGFWIGMVSFFMGFICVYSGQTFWNNVARLSWPLMLCAFTFYLFRMNVDISNYSFTLTAVESNLWIFTVFGFGYKYLNRPSDILRYLSKAAYPVYIIHMLPLYTMSYLIFPLDISPILKFTLVSLVTFVSCFTIYEFVIRRVSWVRPLFGVRLQHSPNKAKASLTASRPNIDFK